jgi:diguanylate cyclase (GGDEF)-like protein
MHAYVEVKTMGCWVDEQVVPLEVGDENLGYCFYFFEMTEEADMERLSSVNVNTAEVVIRSILTLMSTEDFKQNVWFVLEDFRRTAEAMACRIVLVDEEAETAENFCGAFDLERYGNRPTNVIPSYDVIKTWKAAIGDGDFIILQNEYDFDFLEDIDPIWYRSLKDNGISSLIITPLIRLRNTIGYMYIINYNTDKTADLRELIEIMSYVLGSEIANNQMVKKLAVISGTDGLTGLNNRYTFKQRLENILANRIENFGIVNMDLNGLKNVNDSEGHDEGDAYILKSVEAMKKVFDRDDLYRVGGDEFLAILTSISRDEFEEKVATIKEITSKDPKTSMAIGAYYSEGDTSTRDAIKKADEQMYQNKKEYYANHPELDRRNN